MNSMKYYLTIFLMAFSLGANADIHQLWETMPDSILVHKSLANIIVEKERYLKASLSSALEVQMRHVVCDDGTTYIILVRTYSAPAKDSVVEAYDINWNKINTLPFTLAQIIGKQNAEAYGKYFEPLLISASLSEDADEITLTVSDVGLTDEEKEEIKGVSLQTNVKLGS